MKTLYNLVKQNSSAKTEEVVLATSSDSKLHYTTASDIDAILDKKIDAVTAKETQMLDNYSAEAAGHDCDFYKQCTICWRAMKINKVLEKIYCFDEMTENEIERGLSAS